MDNSINFKRLSHISDVVFDAATVFDNFGYVRRRIMESDIIINNAFSILQTFKTFSGSEFSRLLELRFTLSQAVSLQQMSRENQPVCGETSLFT